MLDPLNGSVAGSAPQPSASAPPSLGELGRSDFLRLLIAQLEHQDPLQPARDREFVAELATFSSLEQLIGVNQNLRQLALAQATLVNAQALNLIGKEALVESGDTIEVRRGLPSRLVYALPRPAARATLTILRPDGSPLRVFELERTPGGRFVLPWDGTDADGRPVPDGSYRFEVHATDLQGEPMALALFQALPIDGVQFGAEGVTLVSGTQEIPFDRIVEIRAESGAQD